VVVHILSNVLKIVVLSSGANALLAVGGALKLGKVGVRIDSSEENRLELHGTRFRKGRVGRQKTALA
jgi:hypothetical protein